MALSCRRYPRPAGSWRDAYAAPHRRRSCTARAAGWSATCCECSATTWFVNLYGGLQINATADQFDAVVQGHLRHVAGRRLGGGDRRAAGADAVSVGVRAAGVRRPTGSRMRSRPCAATAACSCRSTCPAAASRAGGSTATGSFFDAGAATATMSRGTRLRRSGTGALLAPLVAGQLLHRRRRRPRWDARRFRSTPTRCRRCRPSIARAAPSVPDDLSRYRNLTLFYPSSVGPQFTTFAQRKRPRRQFLAGGRRPVGDRAACARAATRRSARARAWAAALAPPSHGHHSERPGRCCGDRDQL